MTSPDALAIVVVTYDSAGDLPALARTLLPQLRDGDELVVVDNASSDGTAALARNLGARVHVVETGANVGFAAGVHTGVADTTAPLVFVLNPDCQPAPRCLDKLRAAASDHADWDAWMAAVLLPDGRINSSGGVVHYLGIGWAGDNEQSAQTLAPEPYEVAFPSGAAMVIRRSVWERTGGLDPDYFMYAEDLDLGLRLWLMGRTVGCVPAARVAHSYAFHKGAHKWFQLERNRWRTVLSVYPPALLALVLPALLAAELALLAVAASQGWLKAKLQAQRAVAVELPATLRRRRRLQRERRLGSREFAAHLTASLDSPYLSAVRRVPGAEALQGGYWRAVRAALRC